MQIFLGIANFCIVVAGLAVTAIGVVVKTGNKDWFRELHDFIDANSKYNPQHTSLATAIEWIPWLFVGFGCFLTIVAFLACCGSACKSPCMMCTYSLILSI